MVEGEGLDRKYSVLFLLFFLVIVSIRVMISFTSLVSRNLTLY